MNATLPDLSLDDIRQTARDLADGILTTPVAPLHGSTVHHLLGMQDIWMSWSSSNAPVPSRPAAR